MSKLSEAIAAVDGPEWDELLQVVLKVWHDYDWHSVIEEHAQTPEPAQVAIDPVLRSQLLGQVEVFFCADRLPIRDPGLRRRAWEVAALSAAVSIPHRKEA